MGIAWICPGATDHNRLTPVKHQFTYPLLLVDVALNDLDSKTKIAPGFSYNKWNVLSLYDTDYLPHLNGTLYQKALQLLQDAQLPIDPSTAAITLLTSPRYVGYVFNPVSFLWITNAQDDLVAAVALVNNTFKETHTYVLTTPKSVQRQGASYTEFQTEKVFYVSPFFKREGAYKFLFKKDNSTIEIHIDYIKDDAKLLYANIRASRLPLTTSTLIKTLAKYPLTIALTMPRIIKQAIKLKWERKLPVIKKPHPSSNQTISLKKPSGVQKLAMKLILNTLSKITKGKLILKMPNGDEVQFGQETGLQATLKIKTYSAFSRLIKYGEIGFGEGYVDGDWDTDDLTALLSILIHNMEVIQKKSLRQNIFSFINTLQHRIRPNTQLGSKKNIQEHYDLSNDLFTCFLDERMMYSSAVYAHHSQSLEEAQLNKIHTIIQKLDIQPADHILEIGSGWGGFAIEAAKTTGCKVTTITISQAQYDLALEKIKAENLQDRITIKICDYRDVTGQFDKIVSIEMLEAVGHAYLPTYFKQCEQRLKQGGKALIQCITIPHERYQGYRKGSDWIQKHIFPGGHLPSLTEIKSVVKEHTGLVVQDAQDIGLDYAPTLQEWRNRFIANQDKVFELGFDESFVRKFNYYFSYCEAGFKTQYIHDYHVVLGK